MADEYRRFQLSSSDPLERECLLAEAFEAGAAGAEESDRDGCHTAWVYAPASGIEEIRQALRAVAGETASLGPIEALPDTDWREAWKQGLEALRISQRLRVRPPFVEAPLEPGQREIVIEPGQAFGTGGHASTRLCLEWIDRLASRESDEAAPDRVLDVGTGSGVLALAAVRLGASCAIGLDLDPVAVEAARKAARHNELEDRTGFFAGPIDALRASETGFDLVLANLLKREMLPIAEAIARRVGTRGRLVLAGLLEEDVPEVLATFEPTGLVEVGRRTRVDGTGCWVGLCLALR